MEDITAGRWARIPRGSVKRGEQIKAAWSVGPLQFFATGTVEEKPHRIEGDRERIRLKLSQRDRYLHLAPIRDRQVESSDAGFSWDGWLFIPDAAAFWRVADENETGR